MSRMASLRGKKLEACTSPPQVGKLVPRVCSARRSNAARAHEKARRRGRLLRYLSWQALRSRPASSTAATAHQRTSPMDPGNPAPPWADRPIYPRRIAKKRSPRSNRKNKFQNQMASTSPVRDKRTQPKPGYFFLRRSRSLQQANVPPTLLCLPWQHKEQPGPATPLRPSKPASAPMVRQRPKPLPVEQRMNASLPKRRTTPAVTGP